MIIDNSFNLFSFYKYFLIGRKFKFVYNNINMFLNISNFYSLYFTKIRFLTPSSGVECSLVENNIIIVYYFKNFTTKFADRFIFIIKKLSWLQMFDRFVFLRFLEHFLRTMQFC